MAETQAKQKEWHEQWSMLQDEEEFLFRDWIYPFRIEDFQGKNVLECGCGGGQHTSFVAPHAASHTAVDLNTAELARLRNKSSKNVRFIEADIAQMDLGETFDIVFSVGVVHHTDNPDATFENMKKHTSNGGATIVWVYSKEGNWMVENIVEPLRKVFLTRMSRQSLLFLSRLITSLLYLPVYTVYLLPLSFLPYFQYFENFRKLSFERNVLNVFDKLNAPQVQFITRERMFDWFNDRDYSDVEISAYRGVSWRGLGIKR